MIRYAVTIKPPGKRRRIFAPYSDEVFLCDIFEEAKIKQTEIKKNNSVEKIEQIYGKNSRRSMQVYPVECYDSGQPKSMYI